MSKKKNNFGATKKEPPSLPARAGMVLLFLILALWAATQAFADLFDYQKLLGINFQHIYMPWMIILWGLKWYGYFPHKFELAGSYGLIFFAFGLIVVSIKIFKGDDGSNNENIHGSARFANKKDIQRAGLLPAPKPLFSKMFGSKKPSAPVVYVGGWIDEAGVFHYLKHSGPEHVLTYAPTRSGKGVSLVLTTLLAWTESAVISDLKGELWELTAGWRKNHAKNKVLKFQPASLDGSVHWNPLDEVRIGTAHEVGDTQNIAMLIVDPDGKGLNTHWEKTSFTLLTGVILHALYKAKNEGGSASLPSVDAMLSDPNKDVSELWVEMVMYKHIDGQNHPVVGAAGKDMMDRPYEEGGSVLSTAKTFFALYRDPVVAANIMNSEFKIKDLMNHDCPVSLYIVTQPNDKSRLRPLVRILINMIIRLSADKVEFERKSNSSIVGKLLSIIGINLKLSSYTQQKKSYNFRMLGMIDEFPSLGKLDILQESLAFLAGYGIKFYLICQDINQLKSRETGYGSDEQITSNCHIQNAFPPNRLETAEYLSKLTGQTTVMKENVSVSGRKGSFNAPNISRSWTEVQRPLLTPDECLRMPSAEKDPSGKILKPGEMIVYVAGFPAIRGIQPLYFKDPVFLSRSSVQAPRHSDVIRPVFEEKRVTI